MEMSQQVYPTIPEEKEKQKGNTLRKIRKLDIEGTMFMCNTVKEAVRDTKKTKELGSDRIAAIILNHLGPTALRYLTDTMNFSVNSAKIPKIWKAGRFITAHKLGKTVDEHKSFRAFALLPLVAKLTKNFYYVTS